MNDFEIDLRGESDLIKKLKKLDNKVSINAIKKALRKAGHKIKSGVKQTAPVETGNLKKSIKVFNDNSYGSKNGALIRVGADRKLAPHAHLVEFGSDERTLNKPSIVNIGGKFLKLTNTGKMPTNDFFNRGYENTKDEAVKVFSNEIKNIINSI
ncbi:HK97 gp10 family phage protein [Belliella sp. DSM 107340]|uniref:HK97 gp10 family phage protein n=1 Tax=Belliella calami TaxID=2923436 RepID=A0ABS9UIW9_9BACT|nr:HK97-gp10 family putative phage morphogenesis protein [Belliella calami]MCH7396562.1 HK97 gp10 family phage protein [Belliella calami]